jgi:hypothetical protein
MNRRHVLLLGAAGLLLALNVWHWWPKSTRSSSVPGGALTGKTLRVEDFVIQGVPGGKLPPAKRDVFQAKRPVVVKPPPPMKPPEPPPKSAEELELEAAHAEYAQIRCLAVAFRDSRGQAMLSSGQQIFHVGVGERVGNRFVVNKIETNGVQIRDPKTGVGGMINLSETKQ